MRKTLLLSFVLALLTAFTAPAKTIEINFTSDEMANAPSSLSNTFFEIPNSEVTLMAKGMLKSNKQIGIAKANKSFGIYNKTPLANIQKVEIHLTSDHDKLTTSTAGNFIITTSDTQLTNTGTGTDGAVLSNDILTFTPSITTNSYFRIDLKTVIGGTAYATKMVITYDEGSAVETVPETPTFSVAAGEVAKGTTLTITSKGATSLTVKSKTADATDWTSDTVTGDTYTTTITEDITYNVVGTNSIGDSEAAEASYTVVETPVEAPATPTFSVAAGEVAKDTEVTITSTGATSLEVKTKTADATDWTTNTVTGDTYTTTITEAIDFEVVGINEGGRSAAASASYTIKADTPIPGGNITATVIFKNQTTISYGNGKEVVWVAENYPSITFNTIATVAAGKTTYPTKVSSGNLRIYNSNGNVITINAPEGYTISQASATYTKSAILIDNNQLASNEFYTYETPVKTLKIESKKISDNYTEASAMTFVLVPDAPVVPEAPTTVNVTPSKAEAKVGETVSVTITADGTPAPDIYYTTDGTAPTTESTKYAESASVTCEALADDEESKVITVNALAHNDSGEATGSATVTFTRNDAAITVKDAAGNAVAAEGASIVFEDGAKTFKAESASDGAATWSAADASIVTVEDGVITPVGLGSTTVTVATAKTGKYNAATATFNVTVTSPYTYATVIFRKQETLAYASNTQADWISEPVDGATYTFATSVGEVADDTYQHTNISGAGTATNLTIYEAAKAPVAINAPEGYVFVRASYAAPSGGNSAAINGTDLAPKAFLEIPEGASTLTLNTASEASSATLASMTFAMAKAVAPTSLVITANKTDVVIGQTVTIKIAADENAFPVPTIYYTRDGSTPVPGDAKTEVYNPAKGFTIARSVPQTVTINAIAVNAAGQVAAEPVSIVYNDKDHVAPTAITFSQAEGTYAEDQAFNVKLAADAEAYPAPTLYYTIGGFTAQGDNHIAYDDAQGIDVAKPANGNVVTINAYAANDAGAVINAATYVFSSETSTAKGWIRIQDASQLTDGLETIVAYASAADTLKLMTPEVYSNGGLESTEITCDNTNGVIAISINDESKAQHVILEGNATDGWYLKLADTGKYIMPKYNNSKKDYENGLAYTTDKSTTIPAKIDLSDGNAYVSFNGTNREFVYNSQARIFAGYSIIADTQRRPIDFFCEGEYTIGKPYEDLYLVMKSNEIDGAEVAMPFTYEGDGRYTLSVNDLQGTFYIRDGKANHGGTYFGASVDECIDPETSTGYVGNSIDLAVTGIKGEPSTGVKDNNDKDVYAYVGKNGRTEFTLVYDPAQESHYVFSTHPNSNIGHVARIDHADLTVEYTPGSHTNGRLLISGMNTTGVDDISADSEGQARYFNLQGLPVANPANGIYIRVLGGTATKVYVK